LLKSRVSRLENHISPKREPEPDPIFAAIIAEYPPGEGESDFEALARFFGMSSMDFKETIRAKTFNA
jgi:hypothetical protein